MDELKGLNGMAIVALVALLVLALIGRAWLGMTGPGQVDPVTLIVSCVVAVAGLTLALPSARERVES